MVEMGIFSPVPETLESLPPPPSCKQLQLKLLDASCSLSPPSPPAQHYLITAVQILKLVVGGER